MSDRDADHAEIHEIERIALTADNAYGAVYPNQEEDRCERQFGGEFAGAVAGRLSSGEFEEAAGAKDNSAGKDEIK